MEGTRKLGLWNAERVLKAFSKDKQHFGFIKVSKEKLSELTSLYDPVYVNNDLFTFKAGNWMIVIVTHPGYVDVTIVNPYAMNEDCFTTRDI